MDRDLVNALRARGVDVITAADAQMMACSDEQHLEYAASKRRILYSFNRGDFYQLHTSYLREGRSHAGIILALQQRFSIGEQMRQILTILTTKTAKQMQNNVEFIKG